MRTIKFRAWHPDEGNMYYFNCFKEITDWQADDFYRADNTDDACVDFMQFTGLHDKNGKEIYEKDIILIDAYTYEGPEFDREYLVKYNELLGMWTLINLENYNKEKEDFITFEELNGWYRLDIKLLGNIYENKELLNETDR